MDQLKFEVGNHDYLSFILDAIIESEKSNSSNISYCTLFNITEAEFRETLTLIFKEEIFDFPWLLSNWTVGFFESTPVCALTSWLEKPKVSSEVNKLQALNYYLQSRIDTTKFSDLLLKLQKVSILRVPNYLQLEHMYTIPAYRGRGFIKTLIKYVLENNSIHNSQIQLTANNQSALKAYLSLGYEICESKCEEGLVNLKLLPNDCKFNLILKNE
jgi:hypothetical protein